MILAALLLACKVDAAAAERLVRAQTLAELDAAAPRNSIALRALYRHQRWKLHPTADEELKFFRSLPASQEELDCVYQLSTLDKEISESEAVGGTVYEMFEDGATLAHKYRTGFDRVLKLVLWSNAETGEIAWPILDTMLDSDPEPTAAAIRRLPVKTQKSMCNEFDVRKRSTKFIVEHCKSNL